MKAPQTPELLQSRNTSSDSTFQPLLTRKFSFELEPSSPYLDLPTPSESIVSMASFANDASKLPEPLYSISKPIETSLAMHLGSSAGLPSPLPPSPPSPRPLIRVHDLHDSPPSKSVKLEPATRTCHKCGIKLTGEFVRAMDKTWHLKCFQCAVRDVSSNFIRIVH